LVGLGRIGRNIFRILYKREDIRVAAISEISDHKGLEYLPRFDTVLGRFPDEVSIKEGNLYAAGRSMVRRRTAPAPGRPRRAHGDEATSKSRTRADLEKHLAAGAKRVISLAPPADAFDLMVVMGVNDDKLDSRQRIVSNASSTVHAVTPILRILNDAFGVKRAIFTTIHSYTSQHRLADVPAEDMRRGRAAAENIIPQESRSPRMVAELLPELAWKVTGYAMNVPVRNGSVVDLVCWYEKKVTPVGSTGIRTAAGLRWRASSNTRRSRSSRPRTAAFPPRCSLATMVMGEHVSALCGTYEWVRAQPPRGRADPAVRA
jgi:glyceraldehyde 3-phosphate dehydrogenase